MILKRAAFTGMRGRRAPFNGMRGKRVEGDLGVKEVNQNHKRILLRRKIIINSKFQYI